MRIIWRWRRRRRCWRFELLLFIVETATTSTSCCWRAILTMMMMKMNGWFWGYAKTGFSIIRITMSWEEEEEWWRDGERLTCLRLLLLGGVFKMLLRGISWFGRSCVVVSFKFVLATVLLNVSSALKLGFSSVYSSRRRRFMGENRNWWWFCCGCDCCCCCCWWWWRTFEVVELHLKFKLNI